MVCIHIQTYQPISDFLGLCLSTSCLQLLGDQAHCFHNDTSLSQNISGTHAPCSFSGELLLLSLTTADKPHEVAFPHALHITVPQPLLVSYDPTAYLWEEEKVAQDFISSEGSDKSNSNISREALVLKVASSCWADVPAKKHAWQWESHDTQKSNAKAAQGGASKHHPCKKDPEMGSGFCYLNVVLCNPPPHGSPFGVS